MLTSTLFDLEIYKLTLWVAIIVLAIVSLWNLIYLKGRKQVFRKHPAYSSARHSVSVIIPAFNEEKNIGNTLQNILDSDYPRGKMEILVVDDGSTDRTEKVVRNFIRGSKAAGVVRIVSSGTNMGKCSALNLGIKNAKGEIVITTDADTKFQKDTIRNLAAGFEDEKVGAVAGYFKAGQSLTFQDALRSLSQGKLKQFSYYFLEKFQNLEYITFLFTRKRQEILDAIMVVPGSIGAYRKSVLREVGGFDPNILIEDYDMTLQIHKAGYKVRCYQEAEASTIPPKTWKELMGQRVRWYRGGMQVMSKHFDLVHSRHGFVSFVFGFEYVNVFLQFFIWSLMFSGIFYKVVILRQDILFLLSQWIQRFLAMHFIFTDMLFVAAGALFLVGLFEVIQSVKLTGASRKTLLFYPISGLYAMFLGYVWLYSFFAHITHKKVSLSGSGWKGR